VLVDSPKQITVLQEDVHKQWCNFVLTFTSCSWSVYGGC